MDVTGPASVQTVLYDSGPFVVLGSVGTNLAQYVPDGAPLGTYTIEVLIYRDGEVIDSDAFQVEVDG